MPRSRSPLPAVLSRASGRFEKWRRHRRTRRIPEELWSLATDLASRHGVSRTARVLRIQYDDLRKRVEAASASSSGGSSRSPAFVEILPRPSTARPQCVMELESPSGVKMRIEVHGGRIPDLAGLTRLFLERRQP